MRYISYFARRLLKGGCVMLLILVMNFILIRLAPGDPASVLAGQSGVADARYVAALRQQFRLDDPLWSQLISYVGNALRFDFGYSYTYRTPVFELIAERLPATLLLTGTAFVMSLAGGIALGSLSASYHRRWPDTIISAATVVLYATPLFWLGLMLMLILAVHLQWLPPFGMGTVGGNLNGLDYAIDVARSLILPAVSLSTFMLAIYARLMRSSLLAVRRSEYIKTAHAKGVPPRRILIVHMGRNALLPVLTLAGLQAGQLIGGAVITETVFAWPGIGRLTFDAVSQRDYNLLLAILFVSSAMVVMFNLITDLIYTFVDPRIELSR